MSLAPVEKIANAVLYEGYILYPYRPSALKNRQRWTFGVLYPEAYGRASEGTDPWSMQTQCLIEGGPEVVLEGKVRFLHLLTCRWSVAETTADHGQSWQEGVEREVVLPEPSLRELVSRPRRVAFAFPGCRESGPLSASGGQMRGVRQRLQEPIAGSVELSAEPVGEALYRVTVRISNTTSLRPTGRPASGYPASREEVLLCSLASAHTILGVRGERSSP